MKNHSRKVSVRRVSQPSASSRVSALRLTPFAAALAAGCFSLFGAPAGAANINVGGGCTLVNAIVAANLDTASGGCAAGSGADTLILQAGSTHTLTTVNNSERGPTGLPVIASDITIQGNGSTITRAPGRPTFVSLPWSRVPIRLPCFRRAV